MVLIVKGMDIGASKPEEEQPEGGSACKNQRSRIVTKSADFSQTNFNVTFGTQGMETVTLRATMSGSMMSVTNSTGSKGCCNTTAHKPKSTCKCRDNEARYMIADLRWCELRDAQ